MQDTMYNKYIQKLYGYNNNNQNIQIFIFAVSRKLNLAEDEVSSIDSDGESDRPFFRYLSFYVPYNLRHIFTPCITVAMSNMSRFIVVSTEFCRQTFDPAGAVSG
jgi:hypothetical protein